MPDIPLFGTGLLATSVMKAFVVGSVTTAIATLATVEVRLKLEGEDFKDWSEMKKIAITLGASLTITLFTYLLMYVLFGYGGGMVSVLHKENRVPNLFENP